MAYTWPTPLSDDWQLIAEPNWNDMDARITVAQSTATNASTGFQAGLWLDSFPQTTADARLTAAMTQVAGETVKRPIWLNPGRRYDFATTSRSLFSGFKLVCPGGFGNQQRAANSIPCDVRFSGNGTWFVNNGTTYDVMFAGMGLQGNSNGVFMTSNPGVLWTSVFRDLGFNLWKHVWGTPSSKFLNTAILIDGWGNINNSYNTAATFGGSDSTFFDGKWLIDSPPSIMAAGAYHLIFDYQEESTVGKVYMTAEQNGGVLINGGATTKGLRFLGGFDVEGRNSSQPCYGSLFRINGGGVDIKDAWLAYAASNLNANGRSGELGVITVAGSNADVFIDGCWYDRSVAESVKFVGISSGSVRIRNIRRGAKGGSWSGLPQVSSAADSDSTVTEV
jgi:hypothetical protein